MQFTPKTEAQISDSLLLPAGEYDFQITAAKDTTSKAGNPMIAVDLDVFTADGSKRHIKDYLMETMAFKLRHFCFAVGLGATYEAGKLDAAQITGRGGRVKIGLQPAKGEYQAQNIVKDYISGGEKVAGGPVAVRQEAPPERTAEGDIIPF